MVAFADPSPARRSPFARSLGPALSLLAALALAPGAGGCSSEDEGSSEGSLQGASAGGQAGAAGQGGASGGKAGASSAGSAGSSGGGSSSGGSSSGGSSGGGVGSAGGPGGGGPGTGGAPPSGGGKLIGQPYEGGLFHLGPVDWDETQFHNACAPGDKYRPEIRKVEGELLAGLWVGIPDVASLCDACIVVDTKKGKSAVLRVVTYGDTTPNSIDVSPAAYELLNSGEDPRAMTWQLIECPDTGGLMLEFQTGSSEWWTSLWIRNARVPIVKAEVKSQNHPDWAAMERGSDGTLTDASGFGKGDFSLRLTGADGQQLVEQVAWPADGIQGKLITSTQNFP